MRLSQRARFGRAMAALGLAVSTVLPAAATPAAAADPLILRVGTTQDLDSLNPYATALVVGYEAFQLTYDLLVNFGPDLEPSPGFAESWSRSPDGHSWVFKIRPGMVWSDGQPATSADACFSFGLDMDAINHKTSLGLGYIDPALSDAAATKVECPDDQTMVITTDDPSNRILQTYIPILPKHIWSKETYKTIGDAKFNAPLVGSGPYQVAEWKTGQYVRFVRNPHYWGPQGAADQVIIQIFKSSDTMVQALKAREIDYVHDMNADQFKQLKTVAGITTVAGTANGWTELGFNTYGTGTGKTIKGGGPSTKALLDPKFRDAIGYAIDKQALIDKVRGGFGTIGTTQVPPVLSQWHVDPTDPRTFNIQLAEQKLDAAGYHLDASGHRLDLQGKPLNLRMVMPDSDESYPKDAQFIQGWLQELGIKVTTQVYDSATLTDLMLPPEAGGASNKANYDLFVWDWAGNPDPNALLQIFLCNEIGTSSDSNYCNPTYDQLYKDQNKAATPEARKAILAQMQQLFYDEAPYHILYYDTDLDAYRTDKFGGWQNQPLSNGIPFMTYGTIDYTLLKTAAEAAASPSPAASGSAAPVSSGASTAPTATPGGSGTPTGSGGDNTLVIVLVVVVIVVVVGGFALRARGRREGAEDE